MAASGSRGITAALLVLSTSCASVTSARTAPISVVPVLPSVCPSSSATTALQLALIWECRAQEQRLLNSALRKENLSLREEQQELVAGIEKIAEAEERRSTVLLWLLGAGLALVAGAAALGLGMAAGAGN